MKKLFYFFVLLMGFQYINAQSDFINIDNVTWEEDRVREEVIITYDLEKNEKYDYYNINVKLRTDENNIKLDLENLSNQKEVQAGLGNKIRWIVPEEYRGLPSNAIFVLSAKGISRIEDNRNRLSYILGGIGLASVIYGITEIIPAQRDYDDNYVPNTNPDDPFYWSEENTSRAEYYKNTNDRYNRGSKFVAVGAGIAVVGAIFHSFKNKNTQGDGKEKRKKIKKEKRKNKD